MIPIVDLKAQYQSLKEEIDSAMQRVAASGQYILGPSVAQLERDVARYCQCSSGIGVGNGTDALHLALRALRIGPGDEVITSPFTFIATSEAIGMVGARAVFADIDLETFNIDPDAVGKAITAKTRAILPVHLYGQPCDMDPIMTLARQKGIHVVEDCAQALGATYKGRPVGGIGDVGCLSFFPSKNLGCFGDGGMVVTNNPDVAERVEMLRRHGGQRKYYHTELGMNSRLDELQASILHVKLKHLACWNAARRQRAERYNELLGGVEGIALPRAVAGESGVYNQYTIRIADRDARRRAMADDGIQTAVYYPVPLHLQEANAGLGYRVGAFPKSEMAAETCLSLPIYPEISVEQQHEVACALGRAASRTAVHEGKRT